ncbi:S-locus-specific glycoprotein S13-like [Capsicum annuum]|uniref:S-locus-specific glycoprotein S13-like n=1 Tax=Capsicum annuum TaxID=4072 RepID=UPI001FB194BF|nr:S-locus-specific glycoprotein S13-like [Capsicum annuum]
MELDSVLVLWLVFSSSCLTLFASEEIIEVGKSITGNQKMVSADGTFALGFFTPGNSTFSYLGIWYNTIPGQTVVWVANRESPIPQHSTAVFTIGDDGNLVLFDEKDKLIWSSNVSSTNSTIGALLDNGNLVLTHGEFNILWQSFEHPTDTFLPEMKIGYNGKTGKRIMINSWTSNEDPQPGNFSFGIDPEGRPRLYIFKQNSIHFRFDDTYEYLGGNLRGTAWYLSIVSRNDEVYLTYGYIKGWITLRVFVDPAGHLQVLFCTQYANKWKFIFQVPQTLCDIYAQCGPFGSCGGLTSELCMCLTGFKPKFSTDWDNGKWTDGCVRKVALGCDGKDRFLKYENMKLPDHTISFGHMSVNECETQCIRNCSCSAYAYLNSTCLIWIGDYWTLAATILMAEFSMFDFMALSQLPMVDQGIQLTDKKISLQELFLRYVPYWFLLVLFCLSPKEG